jgi:hypothetical protein
MAEPGDEVTAPVSEPADPFGEETGPGREALLTVLTVRRRVPEWVRLAPRDISAAEDDRDAEVADEARESGADYAPGLFSALFQERST